MGTVLAPEAGAAGAGRPPEQSRARYPAIAGIVERDGARIGWESYGQGDPPIVFVPPWPIVHSRVYKAQIPDFARRHRVIAWDDRGNGRSDRPLDPGAHSDVNRSANLAAVMDAAGLRAGVLIGLSSASRTMIIFAAIHPERVLGLAFICPATPFAKSGPPGRDAPFEEPLDDDTGWNKENIHFWRRDFRGYLDHFFNEAFPEPHSTKQREDAVGYGLDTDPESLAATVRATRPPADRIAGMCASIQRPVLVIQGTDDRITHVSNGPELARRIPGARLELIEGGGHIVNARDPVRVNLLLREFIGSIHAVRR